MSVSLSVLHHSLLRINTIEFEELSEERVRGIEDDEEEGGIEGAAHPECIPTQEEEEEAVLAEGMIEPGVDGTGEQSFEGKSLSSVDTNNDRM